ncbi:UDP-N-acetylmuramate dehydrogenase [Sediminibacterium roseum]|uniref:UDP-N-acetylenolpyruvoylglucosamine reductase n=1 Tax=Sediminibacterium roseum TaxID=1978412 RepID=A0ABW9ZU83_9BACT|nr:UDP-N-acetylmuramate dehydrogenase [Sediminibacterium roseum]NCI50711.1 UDP-N-acetylmuramate dehydrogenase [Sediminibacterium roseum]
MQIEKNISLKPYNTFGIDAVARRYACFSSVDELALLTGSSTQKEPLLILGGGSNILFRNDFDGLVLKNELKGIELTGEDADYYYVRAHAGENWHGFVQHCIAHQYAGVENLSLVPGNVGASPMQNIGAYGVEIKDVFHELEAWHLNDRSLEKFSLVDCEFGYRESVFKKKYRNRFVILNVTFRLRKQPVYNTQYGAIEQELEKMGVEELSIENISRAVINIRTSKLPDPKIIGNAGSFFKNPVIGQEQFDLLKASFASMPGYPAPGNQVKTAAGWLIEQCGWKGYREGDAGCYDKQALVLVNYGKATGDEIFTLSQRIIDSVQQKFGIALEREVNIV